MTNFYSRTINLANYLVENKTTIRKTAKYFSMAKSTVHYDLHFRLKYIDYDLYLKVSEILKFNFEDKHNRGGLATKEMYKQKRKIKNRK